ncbi:phosphate ABC transporter substrate-binding protein PstS [Demequina sp. B12]|uniref:phosphate ABC transporter substrate-binding protein PstS n=1 Tax=Demequina sp. B12 TaxID=2992757 RepID=UPI00237B127B|nr:phosphate ABC transporter substrate-binding protein PstS [Demequina sp. B12]MDE0573698.1 phosphate ABC transporter substrate-binding protein PstS [Demequina sp. B12]
MTRTGAVASAAALTFALAACSPSNEQPTESAESTSTATAGTEETSTVTIAGNLQGAGASSQESAMDAWRAEFQNANAEVTVGYDPVGSGGGIEQFLSGAVPFAGSDGLLDASEYEQAVQQCDGDGGAYHLPMYISPVAVIFNIDGVDSLNLDAATIAGIFDGTVTTWDDEAIASQNEGVELPSSTITVVHRSDSSGTSENFTDYLEQASDGAWPYEASKEFPETSAQRVGADGTSAVVDNVTTTANSIGYADASRAGSLGTVAIKVGDEYVPFSPEAAANIVSASPLSAEANGENDLAYEIDRTTTDSSAYPLTLVSYHIVCSQYDDETERTLVTEFEKFVASEAGQQASATAAGSAPLTAELSAQITAILDGIAANA